MQEHLIPPSAQSTYLKNKDSVEEQAPVGAEIAERMRIIGAKHYDLESDCLVLPCWNKRYSFVRSYSSQERTQNSTKDGYHISVFQQLALTVVVGRLLVEEVLLPEKWLKM